MSTRDDILTALEDAILALSGDEDYGGQGFSVVQRFWPKSLANEDSQNFPLVVMDDNGNEPGPEQAGVVRFRTFQNIHGIVRGDTDIDKVKSVETMAAALEKYFYSQPSLHDNVLDINLVQSEETRIYTHANKTFATSFHRLRILWYDTEREIASNADDDVFGTQWIDDARDKLVALIEALKTTMATGYTPTFSYVYPRHLVPDLRLNAVSVGLDNIEEEDAAFGGSGCTVQYYLTFSVRVHIAYDDQFSDDQEASRLVNSVSNKIKANLNLGDGYRINNVSEFSVGQIYEDSGSIGGEFAVRIGKAVTHAQE